MGDLYVVQVVVEPRAGDPPTVRVDNVAFEKIEARIVAESQIVRVPYEARFPPEEGLDPLSTWGRMASNHCTVPIQYSAYSSKVPQVVVGSPCQQLPGQPYSGFRGCYYAASRIQTSENSSSTHSGE